MQRIGSRSQVMHGNAKMTGGGLKKKDLKYNKQGKIVSKKMSAMAKKEKRLQKAGYTTKKGQFGAVRINSNKIMKGGSKKFIIEFYTGDSTNSEGYNGIYTQQKLNTDSFLYSTTFGGLTHEKFIKQRKDDITRFMNKNARLDSMNDTLKYEITRNSKDYNNRHFIITIRANIPRLYIKLLRDDHDPQFPFEKKVIPDLKKYIEQFINPLPTNH